jgi:peptidoglycan/LPS O-acetylase OafA/YrhL
MSGAGAAELQKAVEAHPQRGRINHEIQALRAIAILFVLFFHLRGLFPWFEGRLTAASEGMWSGVDLFFCLSGFVIAKGQLPQLKEAREEQFWRATGAFWVRRFFRIAPSAWLWVAIPLAVGFLVSGQIAQADISTATSIFLNVANIHLYECAMAHTVCGQFEVYWSLSLEEQFYLLLPLAIFIFRNKSAYLFAALVLSQIFIPRFPGSSILNVLKTDAILIGVLIAMFSETAAYRDLEPKIESRFLRVLIPALLIFCVAAVPRYQIVSFYTGLLAVVCGLVVWLCSYNCGYFIGSKTLLAPLRWVGNRSFSIYLIHMPAFQFTAWLWIHLHPGRQFGPHDTLRFGLTAGVMLLVLVEANYRFVEIPLRRAGKSRAFKLARAAPQLTPAE